LQLHPELYFSLAGRFTDGVSDSRLYTSSFLDVYSGLELHVPADMGAGGCIDVDMTTSVMASAAGRIVDGGIPVKNSLATAIFPATRTSISNNTQQ
jgi:hypothetical protein